MSDNEKKSSPMKITSFPARPARALWGVPDGQSAGIKIKFSLICKNFNLLNFKMNNLNRNLAFLVAFEMLVWLSSCLLDKPLFAWCNLADMTYMSTSDWWLKLSNFKKINIVTLVSVTGGWLPCGFVSFLRLLFYLGVWWSLLGPAVISLGKKARSGRRRYNDDQVHHNT